MRVILLIYVAVVPLEIIVIFIQIKFTCTSNAKYNGMIECYFSIDAKLLEEDLDWCFETKVFH